TTFILISIFFFHDTSSTDINALSLHDALPICCNCLGQPPLEELALSYEETAMIDHTGIGVADVARSAAFYDAALRELGLHRVTEDRKSTRLNSSHVKDRKSTRLNSSHVKISYAVFCLKKKKENERIGVIKQYPD